MPGIKRKAGEYGGKGKSARKSTTKVSLSKTIEREILKNAEMNENINFAAINDLTTGGQVVLLNYIAEGDDLGNRRGRRITSRAIDVNFMYKSNAANTAAGAVAMVALVYDSQPNGSSATIGSIFDNTQSQPIPMCFKNTAVYKDRFKICWIRYLPEGEIDQTDGYTKHFRQYYKVPSNIADVRYGGTAASTPNTGAWYLVCCDSVNSTTNAKYSYNVKYQYTDY